MLGIAQAGDDGVVGAIVDDPASLVEPSLTLQSGCEMGFDLGWSQVIDDGEVAKKPGPHGRFTVKEEVLEPVAVGTNSMEAGQPLTAYWLVVLPDLMAVQRALATAELAAVTGLPVHGPAQTIPLVPVQEIGQASQARIDRDRLNGQAKRLHVLGIWCRTLIKTALDGLPFPSAAIVNALPLLSALLYPPLDCDRKNEK